MKNAVRIISLALCLLLTLPLLAVAVSAADEKELNLKNLGWKDTTGKYASAWDLTYEAAIATDGIGEAGNKSLFLYSPGSDAESDWRQIEIVPASKLAGVKKYSLSFQMKLATGRDVTWHNLTMFHFGKSDLGTKDGDWVGVRYGTDAGGTISLRSCYYENGARGDNKVDTKFPTGTTLDVKISVDTEAKTVTLFDAAGEQLSQRTTPFAEAGAIGLVLNRMFGWIDNLKLVNDETGATLYSEDFEGFKAPNAAFDVLGALGWKQDTKGYTGSTYKLDITDSFGAEGNKALKLSESDNNWCGIEILPADKMAGVKKYSISADILYKSATTYSFRFGNEANNGDVVGISWNTKLWNALTSENDSGAANYTGEEIGPDKTIRLRAEIDAEAGTVTVYSGDKKLSERADATKVTGGIFLMLRGLTAYMDNLEIKNTETGTVIYTQDFESFPLTEKKAPVRPAQDYTGRRPGEVIFSDNYDAAKTVDDLYFRYEPNTGFGAAKWTLADNINGTNCAKISGTWSQVEIIPAEVFASYKSYTLHMTVMMETNANRFTVMYNSKTAASNADSGFFEMRYNPIRIENLCITGGTVTKDEAATTIGMGQAFELALSVDCENGTVTAYIDGEYVSFQSGLPTTPSAVWIVAESAIGYIDNVQVTAGSYADWKSSQGGEDTGTGEDTGSGEKPTGEKPTEEKPTDTKPSTEAPSGTDDTKTAEKGCKSSVAAVLPVLLVALCGTALVRRKRT